MRRIIVWLTATVVAAALVVAFQLNQSGTGGKPGGGDRPVACTTAAASDATSPATTCGTDGGQGSDDGKVGEHPGQEGKPGENK